MEREPSSPRQTKADAVTRELRSLIACGEIDRGARVGQTKLAERFQTSVTPVREAMRRLEAEGLLVSEPHRGCRVASADLESVNAIYIARRLLEPYAAERAASRLTRRNIESVKHLADEMSRAVTMGDHGMVIEANRSFHFLIYSHSGIPALTNIVENLWVGYPWDILMVDPNRMPNSVQEHGRIGRTLADGDGEGASRAVGEHLRNSYTALGRLLKGVEVQDVFDVDVD